jgi:ribosomal protein S18 acetylase RimI-like enzyme
MTRSESLDAGAMDAALEELAALLHACVHGGASISFMPPFPIGEARRFWVEKVAPGVAAGSRYLLVARGEEGRILGSCQLNLGTPPNQPHRAEVEKVLVHPGARRRGLGQALMRALEAAARERDRSLLTLDTLSGSAAERMYLGLGYRLAGAIPRYAQAPLEPGLTCLFEPVSKRIRYCPTHATVRKSGQRLRRSHRLEGTAACLSL